MDKLIIHVRQYRKSVEIRYVNAETGEIVYDMTMYDTATAKLSDVIRGVEKMNEGRFDNVPISWDVSYGE